MKLTDRTGMRFGRLTVVRRVENIGKETGWLCRCDCGGEKAAAAQDLRSGKIASCGCLRRERLIARNTVHGGARRAGRRAEYGIWKGMRRRCLSPTEPAYKNYGGRGITICERWLQSFEAFLADMGPRPGPEYSIDRKDNDKGYEPGNCRWATDSEQARNVRRRATRLTDEDVRVLRARARAGDAHELLANTYGIDRTTVSHIVHRRMYAHVP